MDYEIELSTLESKKTNLEELKTDSENIFNETNNSFSKYSGTEISGLCSKLKSAAERLKKGGTNSNKWYTDYVKDLIALEDNLAGFSGTSLTEPTEFKGEFIDMFGKVTMPILKTGGDIHANANKIESGVSGIVDGTKLLKYEYNGQTFYIPNTKLGLDEYAAYIRNNKMYQNAGFQGGQCMLLSQYYASDMLRGTFTKKSVMDNHGGSPAVKMNERCKSTNAQDVLDYCFDEINAGNPVVLQVTQKNSYRGARHLVTMVGYTSDVKSAKDLTPDKILVLDCVDGKVQTLSERNRKLFNQGGTFQALGPTEKFLSTIT